MRATFNKLIFILPIVLAFISVDLMGQTQQQLDEIKAYERKIEMNKDNPNFDAKAAMKELEVMKINYGIVSNSPVKEKVNENATVDKANAASFARPGTGTGTETSEGKDNESVQGSKGTGLKKVEYYEKSIKRCEGILSEIASGKLQASDEFKKSVEERLKADKEILNRLK